MLCDMRLCRLHNGLCLRVLADCLSNLRVLHRRLMNGQMCRVILFNKGFHRLLINNVHILSDRISGHQVIIRLNNLIRVLYPHHLQHLPVKYRKIINLRRLLGQLYSCLILNNPLRHCRRVRVGNWQYFNHFIICFFGSRPYVILRVVLILRRCVFFNKVSNEFELLRHRIVDTCLYSTHDLERTLQNSQCRTDRSLTIHGIKLDIGYRRQPTALLDYVLKQLE